MPNAEIDECRDSAHLRDDRLAANCLSGYPLNSLN
jgi:hypothetical protein